MEEERTRLQKIVLLSLAVMTLAFGILTGVSKLHPGVQFGGTLFQPAQTAEKMTYTGKLRGEKVTISVWTEGADVTVVTCETEGWGSNVYRVEYPLDPIRAADGFQKGEMVDGIRILKDGKVLFEGGYDPEGPWMWRPGMTWTAGGNPNRFMPLSAPAALCSLIHWRWTRGMSCTLPAARN